MGRLLRKGMTGSDVAAVQDVLNYHIRRFKLLDVDSQFGPETESRVREFQTINKLKIDGIVGPETSGALFEQTTIPVQILFMPRLQLTLPGSPNAGPSGIQPPRLIPPLQLPTLVPPFNFNLGPASSVGLPNLAPQGNLLNFRLTVPSRLDPVDPSVAARKNIVELLEQLPVNGSFKAFLINKIPDPEKKITPEKGGFNWGASPVFDPFDPKGIGIKGNAIFTIKVTEGLTPTAPHVAVGAWGDGKLFFNFQHRNGQSQPKVEAEGQIILGAKGTF